MVKVTYGIRPGSMFANEMRLGLLRATRTWTELVPTTGNIQDADVPVGETDFETVLLHEIGHSLGLDHPNMFGILTGFRGDFTLSDRGPDAMFDTELVNTGPDGDAGSQDDDRDDDINFFWFRKLDNNPLMLDPSDVDRGSYSQDLADLPSVDPSDEFLNDPIAANISTDFRGTVALAVGDVNGDELPDVVTADRLQGVRLYLNDGTAAPFGDATTGVDILVGTDDYSSVVLGDVDQDGDNDVIVGALGDPNQFFLNDGSGSFGSGTDITTDADNTTSLAFGDVNGDTFPDLVVGNASGTNKLYTNDGSGGFNTAVNITTDTDNTRAIAVGDVNDDGDPDIVAGNFNERNRLYLNDGSGGFPSGTDIGTETAGTRAIAIGNVINDSDGPDVVAGNDGANHFYDNGGGADPFSGVTPENISSNTNDTAGIALADVNFDGQVDIIAANIDGTENFLVLNDGPGVFGTQLAQAITNDFEDSESGVAADVDGDGDTDFIAGNDGNRNRVYLNRGGRNTFAANANSGASFGLGFPATQAIMYVPTSSLSESTRTLTADDIAMCLLAQAGLDGIQGTPDDYTVILEYAGIDPNADVLIDVDDSAVGQLLAVTNGYSGVEKPAEKSFLTETAEIHFRSGTVPDLETTWYFGNPTLSAQIFVDFAHTGPEEGTQSDPFNTLAEGLVFVENAGTVTMEAGMTAATPVIDQAVTLEASGGTVRIGDNAGAKRLIRRTGFVSRQRR